MHIVVIIISHQLVAIRALTWAHTLSKQEMKMASEINVLAGAQVSVLVDGEWQGIGHCVGATPRWLGRDVVLIQAAPVLRDETGNWWHPDMPPFDEGDGEKFKAWLKAQGLELSRAELGDEPEDHPAYRAIFEEANGDFSAWEPEPPAGAGWFMLAISDTEDGPACCWVRRALPAAAAP